VGAGITTIAASDFSAGADAVTANDGESGELDSLGADIENVIGGHGDDVIDCSAASLVPHVVSGMQGNDTVTGSSLADTLWGGTGDDILVGGDGNDTLYGGDGDDVMRGGWGNDLIDGGGFNCSAFSFAACGTSVAAKSAVSGVNPGVNTLDYADRSTAVVVDLSTLPAATQIGGVEGPVIERDSIVAGSIRNLRGGAGNDTLTGDASANSIWGGAGSDTIAGGAGNDYLYGEDGDDVIHGGDDDDFIAGGDGVNQLFGDLGTDFVNNSVGAAGGTLDCGGGTMDIGLPSGAEASLAGCEN
jgi:serralysin